MSLRVQAEADLGSILENTNEFGMAVTLTSPSGQSLSMTGLSNDISMTIDPETGQLVGGRYVNIALRLSTIHNAGLETPRGIEAKTQKPWRALVTGIDGVQTLFKVVRSYPDRAIGQVTLVLEGYTQ
jgi:hypothetical protein